MKNKEKVAVTAATEPEQKKPETEKTYELVAATPPCKPGPIMSADLKRDAAGPRPPRDPKRGPQVATASMGDSQFVAAHGTPEDFARWRQEIAERQARDPRSWRWEKCDKCGLVMRARPTDAEDSPCIRCNWRGRADGGHFRTMTDAEVNSFLFEKAVRDREAEERAIRAGWAARNASRAKEGLEPVALEDYRREAAAEFQAKLKQAQELGQAAAACRRERRQP